MTKYAARIEGYLVHMAQATDRIAAYLEHVSQTEFDANSMMEDAVIRNLEIVGEASRNVLRADPEFGSRYPTLPLQAAYEMRNVLAHGYFEVDLSVVWETTQRDLPRLREQLSQLLKK